VIAGWSEFDTWCLVIGSLTAAACGLLGNFLVLRRMSMMGDAISHAVLPGLAVGFIISGSRDPLPMLIGAAVIGVITALLTEFIHRVGKVETGASMGVVFTSLFAIGLILLVRAADEVDLDPGCVLYGAIELAPLDVVSVGNWLVPRAACVLAVVSALNVLFVIVFYKELKITSFDATLATTLGFRASIMHFALMTLVAISTVAAFEVVGSILVVAMLIVPGATAHLLTNRLSAMLVVSVLVGASGAALGALATTPGWFGYVDTSTAGMMTLGIGAIFFVTMLFAPRHGVLSRVGSRIVLAQRIVREDLLGLLYRLEEHGASEPTQRFIARVRSALPVSHVQVSIALAWLRRTGLVEAAADGLVMTEAGRARARDLVRSHRLWESYLIKHLAVQADHVHGTAMRLEHITGASMQEKLASYADHPSVDPHGRTIPPAHTTSADPGTHPPSNAPPPSDADSHH
jgi:manganese/zinc/iron transport system permease protein